MPALRVNGQRVVGMGVFGVMIWMLFLRFIVPVLGVFYGTALMADEVEDKTITYLFTRPIPRGAVLVGKYLAYLACTSLVVLPSVMLVYFLLVRFAEIPATFGQLLTDLGLLGFGLAVYGALFAFVGAFFKRPLVIGLVFAFGWEQMAHGAAGLHEAVHGRLLHAVAGAARHAVGGGGQHAAGTVPRHAAGGRVAGLAGRLCRYFSVSCGENGGAQGVCAGAVAPAPGRAAGSSAATCPSNFHTSFGTPGLSRVRIV